jgi:hypothetical protein
MTEMQPIRPALPQVNAAQPELLPAWWLRSGHAQTLYRKFKAPAVVEHRRERLELADGDFIDLDWSAQSQSGDKQNKPVVLLIHGLCGCSASPYIAAMQTRLNQDGYPNVAMNLRACSGQSNRLARSYHSGASEDLDEVYGSLRQQYPDKEFIIIAYSLGANILLKWLGESGLQPHLKLAVAVSTPFQLADCSRAMLGGFSRLYGRYFVNRLQQALKEKQQYLSENGQSHELARIEALQLPARFANIWDFDDRVTAPLHGFQGAQDYYNRCSSAAFLSGIANNTLLIQSGDDPLIPRHVTPAVQQLGDHLELLLTDRGGHVGFVDSRWPDWLEDTISRQLSAL